MSTTDKRIITRRNFIVGTGAVAITTLIPGQTLAAFLRTKSKRKLALRNVHTKERAEVTYWKHGTYQEEALLRINELLRDHRRDQVTEIDVNVVDQIFAVQSKVRSNDRIDIISGYRSKSSNEELRQRRRGVAKRSYHTMGRAIDIHIPDVKLGRQRWAAISLFAGGVGYYPRSRFIHLDSGPVRKW